MPTLEQKIGIWEKSLLDLSRRNRLIHCVESRHGFVAITRPDARTLFRQLVREERKLSFVREVTREADARVYGMLQLMRSAGAPVQVTLGEVATSQSGSEQAQTLRLLRSKARLALDEQGQNLLYLAVGFVRWADPHAHGSVMNSPLLLVPVSLACRAPSAPCYLQLVDDEIVLNPTLAHLFAERFHVELPPFDADAEEPGDYFARLEELFAPQGWRLVEECRLGIFSFQKINMYHDLVANAHKALENPVLRAMYAERQAPMPPVVDHDAIAPGEVCRIVSADSSQLDAVECSRQGMSFVLQGPPGTGKSQTITNIIAQALADGKRVLFVSEKMAALQVVHSRLVKAGLGDFCLPLHDHRANKREILQMLGDSLDKRAAGIAADADEEAARLALLRDRLRRYPEQLHRQRLPLGMSLYDAFGRLAGLRDAPAVPLPMADPAGMTGLALTEAEESLTHLAQVEGSLTVPLEQNPWRGYRAALFGQEQRLQAVECMRRTLTQHRALRYVLARCREDFRWTVEDSVEDASRALSLARGILALPAVPPVWITGGVDRALARMRFFADEQAQQEKRVRHLMASMTALPDAGAALSAYAGVDGLRQQLTQAGIDLDSLPTVTGELHRAQRMLEAWLAEWAPAARGLWQPADTLAAARDLWSAAEALSGLPGLSMRWLEPGARQEAVDMLRRLSGAEETIRQARAALGRDFREDVLTIHHDDLAAEAAVLLEQDMDTPYPPLVRKLLSLRRAQAVPQALTAEPDINAMAWLREVERLAGPDGDARLLRALNRLDEHLDGCAGLEEMLLRLQRAGESLPRGIPRNTLGDYRVIQRALDAIAGAGVFPVRWLASRHREEARRALEELLPLHGACAALEERILSSYDAGILRVDHEGMLRRFRSAYTSLFKYLKPAYREDMRLIVSLKKTPGKPSDQQVMQLLTDVAALREKRAKYDALLETRRGLFTDGEAAVLPAWNVVAARLDALSAPGIADVLERMAGEESLRSLQALSVLRQAFAPCPVERICRDMALWLPEGEVSRLDTMPLYRLTAGLADGGEKLRRVKQLLACADAVRRPDADDQSVYAAMKAVAEGHQAALMNALAALKSDQRARRDFDAAAQAASGLLGDMWQGHGTDWPRVARMLSGLDELRHQDSFARLYQLYRQEPSADWTARIRRLAAQSPEGVIASAEEYCPKARQQPAEDVRQGLLALRQAADGMSAALEGIDGLTRAGMSNTEKAGLLIDLAAWAEAEERARASGEEKRALAGYDCIGRHIPWEERMAAAEQLRAFASAWPGEDMAQEPMLSLITAQSREPLAAWADRAEQCLRDYTDSYQQCCALFEEGTWACASLAEQKERLSAAADAPELLEQWQQYGRCMQSLERAGLAETAARLQAYPVAPEQYVRAYDKAFLLAWIGSQLGDAPDVAGFDAAVYGETIRRFQAQDERYLEVSRMLLQNRLAERMPRSTTSAPGELAILRHELGKRTRIMPIRKLFRQIPCLLQRLKPCLMMSPLSVSYFLDSDYYSFDMVIFDEASQIFPQDAIGAILRSKQAIIAGDVKQMPPSNFFAAAMESDEDDDEDDDAVDSTPLGDSILEEASFTLPQISLLWHYRSRDERLIAFSNRHFYKNNLYTFPGNHGGQEDLGVEYVYLPDGVYRNRRNRREAEMCVRLIEQHILRHPERSLGVVAFSEQQQGEIEELLWQERESHPEFNAFFDEDRTEPFFVKSLENVQGDERDTIIFSICYARGTDGRMRLNFGPLGKAGGERRLNVAVTRARCSIRLIGSILPEDIDLNRAKSEGARLLRSYIAYARGDDDAVMAPTHAADERDRFADAVAGALVKQGYTVSRSVGRSACRVDIAVHAGDGSGACMAGILLDGPGYARARTVRDREAIRRSMLKALGWTIIDCWSTDWAEHPDNALRTLLGQLEALAHGTYEDKQLPPAPVATLPEPPAEPADAPEAPPPLALPEYRASGPEDYTPSLYRRGDYRHYSYVQGAILACVRTEQPIHMDVLCQRMAPYCGREKVTSVVRNTVREQLARLIGREITVEEDFCRLRGSPEVTARRAGGRDIEQISQPELMQAMKLLLRSAYGLSREEAIQECARLLGYARTGQRIEARLQETLTRMVRAGTVTLVKDKLQWKGDAT